MGRELVASRGIVAAPDVFVNSPEQEQFHQLIGHLGTQRQHLSVGTFGLLYQCRFQTHSFSSLLAATLCSRPSACLLTVTH